MFPTAYGAITPLFAGTAQEALAHNGKVNLSPSPLSICDAYQHGQYLRPWARPGDPSPAALEITEQKKLWTWLEAQVQPNLTA